MSPVPTVTAKTAITDYNNNMQLSPLHIQDSASNLLTYLSQLGPLISASKIASVVIAGTNTVTAAQAESLSGLPSLSLATGATLVVSDSAANLLLTGNTAGLSIATSIKISGDNTVTAAQSTALATMGATLASSAVLHVVDSATNLLAASYPSGSGTTFTLAAGSNTIDAAQMTSLAALHGFGLNPGATITVIDNATNLLANSSAINKYAATVELSGANVINSAQAVTLVKLKGFMLDGGTITVEDTAANILSGRSTWASKVAGVEISGANTVTASQATTIAGLGSFSLADGATFVVSDSATGVLSSSNAAGVALATSVVLTGTNSVTVAQASILAGLTSLTLGGGASLTIADTAAHLLASSLSFGFAVSYSITGDNTVTAAQSTALATMGATLSSSAVLHVVDSATNLLAASYPSGSGTTFTLAAGSNTIDAAQMTSLAALHGFGLQTGASIIVADSAMNVLANSSAINKYAASVELSGANVITSAQAVTLVKLKGFTLDAGSISVEDTAANILSGRSTWASKVAGVEISGANTVTANQATTIAGIGSFSLANGATFVVSDTAANLVSSGNASGVALATSVVLTGTNSIGVAQATLLAGMSNLTLGTGASLTISDTAANLAAYSLSFGFNTTLSISGDGIVDVAQATTLYSLGATRTQNAVVHLEDSAAALLAASPGALSIATYTLITGANTVTAAQATTLAAMTRFGGVSGSSLTVQDSAANVLANVAAVGQYASNTVLTGENTITAANLVTLFKVYDLTWNTSDPYGLVVNDTYANIIAAQTTISRETIARNYGPNTSDLSYIVSNAPMVAASSLQSSSQVLSFTIADIGANLGGSALVPLEWDDKLTGITVTDHGALNMSYSQFVGLTHVVSLISGQFSIDLTNVPVSAAATIQSNSLVSGFTVADSFNNISSDYMQLQSYSKLSGIDPTYQAEYSQSALSFYAQFNADSLSLSDVPVAGVSGVENLASVAGFTITDTAADFAGKTSTFALLPQVTSINVTGSGGATDLNLVGVVFPATISMGSNTASVSAGLGTPTPTFTGTPDTIELGSGPSTINYALQPGSGIEVISNFAYGLDTLNINLESASSSVLETFDTTLNGKAAIEITSSADPTHGVILAGVTQNMSAANLLSSHVSFTGGYAVIT